MKETDEIMIRGQRVGCYVGVPDEERSLSQELVVHTILSPFSSSEPLDDDIDRTIDYHAVSVLIEKVAKAQPRKLIETLAEDIAVAILESFAVSRVSIEIEKFILPNTRSVGVRITRSSERRG